MHVRVLLEGAARLEIFRFPALLGIASFAAFKAPGLPSTDWETAPPPAKLSSELLAPAV